MLATLRQVDNVLIKLIKLNLKGDTMNLNNSRIIRICYNIIIIMVTVLQLMLFASFDLAEATPVFPSAKGFGTDTRAAYGAANDPIICIVTNLTNSANPLVNSTRNGTAVKTGSLRACIDHAPPANTGKLILFEVSGTIKATRAPFILKVNDPYVSIMGQTAPSPGITLKNLTFHVQTHDVVVKHIRFRMGDSKTGTDPGNRDGFHVSGSNWAHHIYNVVIDHCSISWSIDENFEIYEENSAEVHDITISNCIISEGLKNSIHPEGEHSKGMIIGKNTERISIVGNLFAHNIDRNPLIQGRSSVIVNNLIYNSKEGWGPSKLYPGKTYKSEVAYVGNVAKKGPISRSNHAIILMGPGQGYPIWYDVNNCKLYVDDNICYPCDNNYTAPCSADWDAVIDKTTDDWDGFKKFIKVLEPPLWPTGLNAISSSLVENSVVDYAGARPVDRDAVDVRIINDVINGTGKIINSQNDVGGWPNLAVNSRALPLPSNPHGDDDSDGYTNSEEWLHTCAAEVEGTKIIETLSPPSDLKTLKK